jgi:hypothetical protein
MLQKKTEDDSKTPDIAYSSDSEDESTKKKRRAKAKNDYVFPKIQQSFRNNE